MGNWPDSSRIYIVAFDISHNKIRSRVRKVLKEWRIDGQKSVYECWLTSSQAEELFIQLGEEIDIATDNILMVKLSAGKKMLARGCGRQSRIFNSLWRMK